VPFDIQYMPSAFKPTGLLLFFDFFAFLIARDLRLAAAAASLLRVLLMLDLILASISA
jgi:hypothetical protein